jgi:hypothetical protein
MKRLIAIIFVLSLASLCLADGWAKIDTAVSNGGNAATLQSLDTTNMKAHTRVGYATLASPSFTGTATFADSLKITPEGGIAVLMKNVGDSIEYLGNPVVGAYGSGISAGFKYLSGINSGELFCGVIYDASIAVNAWGWVVVSGRAKVAINYGASATTAGGVLTPINQRKCSSGVGPNFGLIPYLGSMISWQNLGQNARGDTLTMGIIHPFSTPDSP